MFGCKCMLLCSWITTRVSFTPSQNHGQSEDINLIGRYAAGSWKKTHLFLLQLYQNAFWVSASPWYDHRGWLGVKQQNIYLSTCLLLRPYVPPGTFRLKDKEKYCLYSQLQTAWVPVWSAAEVLSFLQCKCICQLHIIMLPLANKKISVFMNVLSPVRWWRYRRGDLLGGGLPTLYQSQARWSYRRRLGSPLLCACSTCEVNCSSTITSHCLLTYEVY